MKLNSKLLISYIIVGAMLLSVVGYYAKVNLRQVRFQSIRDGFITQLYQVDFAITQFLLEAEYDAADLAADEIGTWITSDMSGDKASLTEHGLAYGVVGTNITWRNLMNYVSNVDLGENGYIVLLDDNGVVLTGDDTAQHDEARLDYFQAAMDNVTGHTSFEERGVQNYLFYYTSPALGWKICAVIPMQEIDRQVDRFVNRMTWGFALSLFLLGALMTMGVRRLVVRPIRELEQDIETITQTGDLDQRIAVGTGDEIGQLAVSFNQMTESLRRASDELELQVTERTMELMDTHAVLKQEITERKRAEEELGQAKEAAQAAGHAKSAILSNMSHGFRTPLNAILGFSEMMSYDPNLTADQRDNLLTIERSGKQLLALVDDLLELAEIEAGRVTLQESNFDLHDSLMGLEELFSPRAKAKGVTLTFERTPDVPQYVRMDENKLRQVLMNLLGNAIKFTEAGDITLQVKRANESSWGMATGGGGNSRFGYFPICHLEFRVRDTGAGIASKELSSVFDVFVQTASGKLSCQGAGLGMPISHRFVRMMGGELVVGSELGKGTVFKFDVPVGMIDAAQVRARYPARQVIGLAPDQPVYRLLIADDIEKNREWLVNLLQSFVDPTGNQGFEVREAANGQEAIEIWEEWDPHLIWMDMRMPVLDGRQATGRIKAACESSTSRSSPIIIALTACALEEERELVKITRCDHLARKPLYAMEVLDILVKHLGVRFAYAGEEAEKEAQSLQDALMAMASKWLADLRQATVAGDLDGMTTLIEQVRGPHPALADRLAKLAHDFEHDTILRFIRQAIQG